MYAPIVVLGLVISRVGGIASQHSFVPNAIGDLTNSMIENPNPTAFVRVSEVVWVGDWS